MYIYVFYFPLSVHSNASSYVSLCNSKSGISKIPTSEKWTRDHWKKQVFISSDINQYPGIWKSLVEKRWRVSQLSRSWLPTKKTAPVPAESCVLETHGWSYTAKSLYLPFLQFILKYFSSVRGWLSSGLPCPHPMVPCLHWGSGVNKGLWG